MRTYRQICELIQSRITGGLGTPDSNVTLTEIGHWVKMAIAVAAKQDYSTGVQLDNLEYVGDSYYMRYAIAAGQSSEDPDTGLMIAELPANPISLPRGYDIVSVTFIPDDEVSSNVKGLRLSPQQSDFYKELPLPDGMIPYWINGKFLFYDVVASVPNVLYGIYFTTVAAAMPFALDDRLPAPVDAEPFIVEFVLGKLLPTEQAPKDTMNDGNNIR